MTITQIVEYVIIGYVIGIGGGLFIGLASASIVKILK